MADCVKSRTKPSSTFPLIRMPMSLLWLFLPILIVSSIQLRANVSTLGFQYGVSGTNAAYDVGTPVTVGTPVITLNTVPFDPDSVDPLSKWQLEGRNTIEAGVEGRVTAILNGEFVYVEFGIARVCTLFNI